MSRHFYGSQESSLPEFIKRGSKGQQDAVRILSHEEHRARSPRALTHLPRNSDGTIDWENIREAQGREFWDEPEGVDALAQIIRNSIDPHSEVIVFWATLVIPSVSMPATTASRHAEDIVALGPDFWIFAPETGLVIEFRQDGEITSTKI